MAHNLRESFNIGSSFTETDATMSPVLPFKGEGVQYGFTTEHVCVPCPCVEGLQGSGEKSILLDTCEEDICDEFADDKGPGDDDIPLRLLR